MRSLWTLLRSREEWSRWSASHGGKVRCVAPEQVPCLARLVFEEDGKLTPLYVYKQEADLLAKFKQSFDTGDYNPDHPFPEVLPTPVEPVTPGTR